MSCPTTTNIVAAGPTDAVARLEARMRATRKGRDLPFSPMALLSPDAVRENTHQIMRIFEVDPATTPAIDLDQKVDRMRLFRMAGKEPGTSALRVEIDSNYFTFQELGAWMSATAPDLEVTVYMFVNEPPWLVTTYRAGQEQPKPAKSRARQAAREPLRREVEAYSPPPPTTAPQTRVRGGMTVGRAG